MNKLVGLIVVIIAVIVAFKVIVAIVTFCGVANIIGAVIAWTIIDLIDDARSTKIRKE